MVTAIKDKLNGSVNAFLTGVLVTITSLILGVVWNTREVIVDHMVNHPDAELRSRITVVENAVNRLEK